MKKSMNLQYFDAFRNGDSTVFMEIMLDTQPKVLAFIRKIVKSDCDAQDLTQDVFIKLWASRATVKSADSFYGFLFTIARNTAFNFLKKNAPLTVELDEGCFVDDFAIDAQSIYEAMELDLIIDLRIQNMPPKRRQIFVMSRKQGLSLDEIAATLEISKNTVSAHLRVALEQIREITKVVVVLLKFI